MDGEDNAKDDARGGCDRVHVERRVRMAEQKPVQR